MFRFFFAVCVSQSNDELTKKAERGNNADGRENSVRNHNLSISCKDS